MSSDLIVNRGMEVNGDRAATKNVFLSYYFTHRGGLCSRISPYKYGNAITEMMLL